MFSGTQCAIKIVAGLHVLSNNLHVGMAEPPGHVKHVHKYNKETIPTPGFLQTFFSDGGPRLAQTMLPFLPLLCKTTQNVPPHNYAEPA